MDIVKNTHRPAGLNVPILANIPAPSTDAAAVQKLLSRCPDANITPLVDATSMAAALNVGKVSVKDERQRMGMGSFKALGAAYVIAHRAMVDGEVQAGKTYVTSSAGNHGLSVSAGAKAFGANACITLPKTVPQAFAVRLRALGAEVIYHGDEYTDSLNEAKRLAEVNGWQLLSDTSWPGYTEIPHRLMEGYTAFMAEAGEQMDTPTHIFLQAGVGGLAGAAAAMARDIWGQDPIIVTVEPTNAPALNVCISAGDFVASEGPESNMGRLDCKEASLIALKGLSRDCDYFVLVSEDEGLAGAAFAEEHGMPSTPSGAGGLVGLLASEPHRAALGLDENSHVMLIMSEGPE